MTRRLAKRYATVTASPAVSSSTGTSGGKGFHHDRDALAAADAGSAQSVAAAAVAQRVQQMGGDTGAARAEWMADCDGAAVHVGALAGQAELALHGQILRRERL